MAVFNYDQILTDNVIRNIGESLITQKDYLSVSRLMLTSKKFYQACYWMMFWAKKHTITEAHIKNSTKYENKEQMKRVAYVMDERVWCSVGSYNPRTDLTALYYREYKPTDPIQIKFFHGDRTTTRDFMCSTNTWNTFDYVGTVDPIGSSNQYLYHQLCLTK